MIPFLIKVATGFLICAAILFEWKQGFFREIRTRKVVLDGRARIAFLGLFLGAVGLLFVDQDVIRFVQSIEGTLFDVVLGIGRWMGRHVLKLLVVCYGVLLLLKRAKWRWVAFGTLLAGAAAGVFNWVLKWTFLRARPDSNFSPYSFFNFHEWSKESRVFFSFPSGDVAVVAGVVSYLFCALRNGMWRWFLFLLPLATACYRMDMNRHWPSDTVAAMAVGLVVGSVLFSALGEESRAV